MSLVRRDIVVPISDGQTLNGVFSKPENAREVVIFAHGSGSTRNSSRNIYVAQLLNDNAIATLLIDLLTADEILVDEKTMKFRFDIKLLASRLISVTKNLEHWADTDVSTLPVGYFGVSTGAAAALMAAASTQANKISSVVSRGGRVDLAKSALEKVSAPTLLLVGGNDTQIIAINQRALRQLRIAVEKRLVIVPGAGHTFDEEGAIEEVARHACTWFERHLQQTDV